MSGDLLGSIGRMQSRFSKGQRLIAGYILEHYDKAAFMTAARLGNTVGISESTVVRFAVELGFDGYPQFQKALQEVVRNRLTSVQRMEASDVRIGSADVFDKVLQTDIDAIRTTLDELDKSRFYAAVADTISARKIYIMGIRSAAALAAFMDFYFMHIFENVRNVNTASTSIIFEQLMRIGPGDLFIGITFSRYSRRTFTAANFAKRQGAKVIAITDSLSAPISGVADHVLVSKSDMASFVDSLVAPLSVINALIVAIGLEKKAEIRDTYHRLESIWDEYNVYEKGEENLRESDS